MLGEPLPQAELLSHVPEGGHRLVLSLSQGSTGAAVTGSAHGPAVPMETLAAQQPHWLLLMSGGQLLFPWVFWAGSWGQGQGWWLVRGWCEVGRGCMCVLVGCVCVLMCEHPT